MIRKLGIQWPFLFVSFTLISWLAFDWQPGLLATPLLSACYALAMSASYPMLPKETRPSIIKDLIENVAIAFVVHISIVIYIFAQVIPTRMIAKNDDISPLITVAMTGIAFPFLSFVTRKVLLSALGSFILKRLESGKFTQEEYFSAYSRMAKCTSVLILLVPTLLLYLNRSIQFALLSIVGQIGTELVTKSFVAWSTISTFNSLIAAIDGENNTALGRVKAVALKASTEGGLNQDLNNVSVIRQENAELRALTSKLSDKLIEANKRLIAKDESLKAKDVKINTLRRRLRHMREGREEGEEGGWEGGEEDDDEGDEDDDEGDEDDEEDDEEEDEETKKKGEEIEDGVNDPNLATKKMLSTKLAQGRLDYALGMLAVRWNGEIIAEKGSIIVGALIANLYFRELTGFTVLELIAVAGIFFVTEVLTDVLFVLIMTKRFDIPMLSASPKEDFFSKEALSSATMVAFGFLGMNSCIAMAASAEV